MVTRNGSLTSHGSLAFVCNSLRDTVELIFALHGQVCDVDTECIIDLPQLRLDVNLRKQREN